jgi:NagD protein
LTLSVVAWSGVELSSSFAAEAVVGKPSTHIAAVALERLGLPAADVVMVGDRVLTDIGMARAAGMVGALVLSGATSLTDLDPDAPAPDLILERIDQLLPVTQRSPG